MMATRRSRFLLLIAVALTMSGATRLHAQTASQGPPNALQGFSQNRDQPVHIEAGNVGGS